LSSIEELAALLEEGERLWLMEYRHEAEVWAVTTCKWDKNADNAERSLDYLRGTESPRGDWVAYRRAEAETPELALQKIIEGDA